MLVAQKKSRLMTVGQYLLSKLPEYRVQHIFGVPGDYVLHLYQLIEGSSIQLVGMTREEAAGYAADAYARIRGMGVACVTYGVGGLSIINAVACAYAEKSPVVIVGGGPGIKERQKRGVLLHHRVRNFFTQKRIFDQITVASALLGDTQTACSEIDRVFDAVYYYKRPGYIEVPRDLVNVVAGRSSSQPVSYDLVSGSGRLDEAVQKAADFINRSKRPVILAGVEVQRWGFQNKLLRLMEEFNIPAAATVLGKSAIPENHPLYLGVYAGVLGQEKVRKFVENSDCVIILGMLMTDVNLGINTVKFSPGRSIYASVDKLLIQHDKYKNIRLGDFLDSLFGASPVERRCLPKLDRFKTFPESTVVEGSTSLTVRRLFEILNRSITDEMTVVADVGDSLFGAIDLQTRQPSAFLSPAYYAPMGFAVPASIGAQLARPQARLLVLVGDGAFQVSGLELSTSIRLGLNPIVVVLNNRGYSTQRQLQDGSFNDIWEWRYHELPAVLQAGQGFLVRSEGELENAWRAALAYRESFTIINVQLEKHDSSWALRRLAREVTKRV